MLLTVITALTLSNLILRPVLAVTTSIEQLATGNTEVKVNVAGSDEFSNLADKFNVLSRRIRTERNRWESERGGFFNALRTIQDLVMLIDSDGTLLFANPEAQGYKPAGKRHQQRRVMLRLLLGAEHPLMQLIGPALAAGAEVPGPGVGNRRPFRSAALFSLGPVAGPGARKAPDCCLSCATWSRCAKPER